MSHALSSHLRVHSDSQDTPRLRRHRHMMDPDALINANVDGKGQLRVAAPTVVRDRPIRPDLEIGQLSGYHQYRPRDDTQLQTRPYKSDIYSSSPVILVRHGLKETENFHVAPQAAAQGPDLKHFAPTTSNFNYHPEEGLSYPRTVQEHRRFSKVPPTNSSQASLDAANVGRFGDGSGKDNQDRARDSWRSGNRPSSYPTKNRGNLGKPAQWTQLRLEEPLKGYTTTTYHPNTLKEITSAMVIHPSFDIKPLPAPPPPSKLRSETHPLIERDFLRRLGPSNGVYYNEVT